MNLPKLSSEVVDENQIITERREKLAKIRAQGGVAFPNDFQRVDYAGTLHQTHETLTREELEAKQIKAQLAGRIMLKRVQGKASFATIQDGSGRIQLYINNEGVGEATHDAFKHWDLGDIVGAEGHCV